MKKTYTKDYQTEIVNQYISGISITNLSQKTGIARSTIYKWIDLYQKSLAKRKPVNLREIFDLKQKCELQEKMIKILQNASCSASASLKERYDAIQKLEDKYSINLLCKTLMVAKGSYYNHILRNKNEDTLAARKRAELTPIIENLFHESNETYGAGKIHAILKDRGYKVAPDTVASIMHDNGWFSVVGGAKKLYIQSQERKQNIIQQNFNVTRPNEVWVGDV